MNMYDSNRIFDSVKKIGYKKTENYEDANCYTIDFISAVMNPNLIEELRPFFDENLEF